MSLAPSATPTLDSDDALRTIYKKPASTVVAKDIRRIDGHFKRFIELSPFLCMGTMGPDGSGDVTPRGGEPGFVHVLNPTTLAMPDRPGNNRLDSLSNLVKQPGIGLLFFIPGFEDVLRVNGKARITTEPELMQRFVVGDRLPLSVVLIDVQEAYLHCPKAIKRAGLWNPETRVDRATFPTAGEIYRDQLALEKDARSIDEVLERSARETLY